MNGESPVQLLADETEQINPAIILADVLMRRDASKLLSIEEVARAEKVLGIAAGEIETIECHRNAFLKCRPTPLEHVPCGF